MSRKGQDNQRGVTFQNKVALLYMLRYLKYSNFLSIQFEGDDFSDFTLFFRDEDKGVNFFHEFEVKCRSNPISTSYVKQIVTGRLQKGIEQYSAEDKFYIVAPMFTQKCKDEIKEFLLFYSMGYKDFKSQQLLDRSLFGDSSSVKWKEEEFAFLSHVKLEEIELQHIDSKIVQYFAYKDHFFYTPGDLNNIISELFKEVSQRSGVGKSLTKDEIQSIIKQFCSSQVQKYNIGRASSLGGLLEKVEPFLVEEEKFKTLENDLTPISNNPRVILRITKELQKKTFKLNSIKWFINSILLKQPYSYLFLDLLKKYIYSDDDIHCILDIINNICNSETVDLLDPYFSIQICELIKEISEKNDLINFREKICSILDSIIPDWKSTHQHYYKKIWGNKYVPKLVCKVFDNKEEGVFFIFKKHDFVHMRTDIGSYYNVLNKNYYLDFIKDFINEDFKRNFKIVVKNLSDQFTTIYESWGIRYIGFEVTGGFSGVNNTYNLNVFRWEKVLSNCIEELYNKTDDWKYLRNMLNKKVSKNNPLFVKRSFIPFLLRQMEQFSAEGKYYKALEIIIEIDKGFPHTEDVVIKELSGVNIGDHYLKLILDKVLCKSHNRITFSIIIIQFIISLIARGKNYFEDILKAHLMNEDFKSHFIYSNTLGILANYITNEHIQNFLNKNKNDIDYSLNMDLSAYFIQLDPSKEIIELLESSNYDGFNRLASTIEKFNLTNKHEEIKKILNLMKDENLLNNFYEKAKNSDYLKKMMAGVLADHAVRYDVELAEKIIQLCIEDPNLCDESESLNHKMIDGEVYSALVTMRSYLCFFSIPNYIYYNFQKGDDISLARVEKSFRWIQRLIDLDGSLAESIEGFPKPNYYLRSYVIKSLISVSYYETRVTLNKFKKNLGNDIKDFALSILKSTKEELLESKHQPTFLLEQIGDLFDVIRDLNEREARLVLEFVNQFEVVSACHLFIYYALFRDGEPIFFDKDKNFARDSFEKTLKEVCMGKPNRVKVEIAHVMSNGMGNDDKLDANNFNKMEKYWWALFKDVNSDIIYSLMRGLSYILKDSKYYYNKYKKYFFKLIIKILNLKDVSKGYFLGLHIIIPTIKKYNPDDLCELILLFLDEGDAKTGEFPFQIEVKHNLIEEFIRVQGGMNDQNKVREVNQKLQHFGLL